MKLIDRVATAFGYAPLARSLAAEAYASPWADSSHLATITLSELYGYAEGINVTRSRAMQVATIAAGRNVIAGTIGRLPLFASKNGTRAPEQPALFSQMERSVPAATTLTWTVDALMFYPCTWWHVLERDSYGWPVWVEWVPAGKARTDADGNLVGIGDRDVRPENVIRFDSPLGGGLLADAARTIKRAIAIEEAAALAEDNPVPTVELHNEGDSLTKTEIEELLDMWQASRRKRGVAYTPKGLKVTAHGTQPSQLLIDGRKAISLELVRAINLPAWAASTAIEGATMTYDNRSLRNWELIDLTLAPYLTAIAGRLSMPDVTPRGWLTRFDTDELTKPDQKTRFETYAIGKTNGFVDNAMIAAWEGWNTIPEETKK